VKLKRSFGFPRQMGDLPAVSASEAAKMLTVRLQSAHTLLAIMRCHKNPAIGKRLQRCFHGWFPGRIRGRHKHRVGSCLGERRKESCFSAAYAEKWLN
jgi:hypothetical protein